MKILFVICVVLCGICLLYQVAAIMYIQSPQFEGWNTHGDAEFAGTVFASFMRFGFGGLFLFLALRVKRRMRRKKEQRTFDQFLSDTSVN